MCDIVQLIFGRFRRQYTHIFSIRAGRVGLTHLPVLKKSCLSLQSIRIWGCIYDLNLGNPQTNKPLGRSPLIWTDFPADINNDTKLTAEYNRALQNHDGYRLLQLARVESDHNYSSKLTPETILKKAYNIAQYNKDPYLLLHITVFEKKANVLNGIEPVEIFEKAYNTAIERKDSKALSLVYTYESINNLSPNINGKNIKEKMNEFTNVEPLR